MLLTLNWDVSVAEVLTIFNTGTMLALVTRMLLKHMVFRYPLFFAYVAFETVAALSGTLILFGWGLESGIYRMHYFGYSTVTALLQVWILLDLAASIFRTGLERVGTIWMLPLLTLLLGGPIFLSVGLLQINGFYRFQATGLVFQMILALLIYGYLLERRDIILGRNARAILGGVALMVGCQGLNFLSFLQDRLPFSVFQAGVPAIYGIALLVFLYGLWEYDDVTILAERRTLNLGLQRSLRLMINKLQPR